MQEKGRIIEKALVCESLWVHLKEREKKKRFVKDLILLYESIWYVMRGVVRGSEVGLNVHAMEHSRRRAVGI